VQVWLTAAVESYESSTYGDQIAGVYDELYEGLFDTAGAVEFLSGLARGGRALELGIGTGRIALPLQRSGVDVSGVDASQAMVDRLRTKAGGDLIPVAIGDFKELPVTGHFDLVFVAFNTFFGLLSQEEQIACFEGVASLLAENARFVLEAFVPDVSRFDRNQRVSVDEVMLDQVRLEVTRHDPVSQRIDSQHVVLSEEGTRLYPVRIRYSYPGELDLMAQLAGLRLQERWGDWRRRPFTSESHAHVSVYARIPGTQSRTMRS
jgi:SAM-dependent methyltransferase